MSFDDSISTASFYEENGKKFGKFFLISDKENLKKWQVTPESIPRRIRTFIGMPFVSEPGLAHFGADNMSLHDILTKQEEYRAGNIVDVQFNANTMEAFAIVEFLNNELGTATWEALQKGEAIYVSPAVAGNGRKTEEGINLFLDWAGIHLARVSSPAYGVFHASIKATCEGPERECVRNLLASASNFISSNDSFNIEGFSCYKNMQTSTTQTSSTATADVQAEVASLKTEVANIKTAFEAISKEKNDESPTSNPSMTTTTAPIKDPIVDPQNHSVGSADVNAKIQTLETKLANYSKKAVASLIETYVSMKDTAGMYASAAEVEEDKKKFASSTEDDMEKEIASITPFVKRMASLNEGKIQNSSNRVISQVASASTDSSKPTSLNDLRKLGVLD